MAAHHHTTARENPISSPRAGRKLPRMPNNQPSLITRSSSITFINVTKVHGPIQLNHFVLNGVLLFLWRAMPGIGLAFVDRIKLPSLPGPHHRSCQPAVTDQLPSATPTYVPSGLISSPSKGLLIYDAARLTVKRSPSQWNPADTSPSPLGVLSNVRMTRGISEAASPTLNRAAPVSNSQDRC